MPGLHRAEPQPQPSGSKPPATKPVKVLKQQDVLQAKQTASETSKPATPDFPPTAFQLVARCQLPPPEKKEIINAGTFAALSHATKKSLPILKHEDSPAIWWLNLNKHLAPTPGIHILKASQRARGFKTHIFHPREFIGAETENRETRPQMIFFVEWGKSTGPNTKERMPPAVPFKSGEEIRRYPRLFYRAQVERIGAEVSAGKELCDYQGPAIPFEAYVTRNLQNYNRFKLDSQWLLWVLTKTEDKVLAAMVNCVLIMFHNMKARHLGKGNVECIVDLKRPFEYKELVDGVLITGKTP